MRIAFSAEPAAQGPVDLFVVAAGKDWESGALARLDAETGGRLAAELRRQKFAGAEGEAALYQTHGGPHGPYLLACGVGAAGTTEAAGDGNSAWYKLAHSALTRARELRADTLAILLPGAWASPRILAVVAEGLYLSAYTFSGFRSTPPANPAGPREVLLLGNEAPADAKRAIARGTAFAAATAYARDLINTPAATATPTHLALEARRLARSQKLRARILDPAAIRRAGMGALLGVAQGSVQPPRFIELAYRPRHKPRLRVALVGKGITFDSGGLSLKPAESMQAQKRDMAGGAAVLAVMSVARDLALPVEVRAYVPATENMPGGRAIKPGDVVRAANGKTIEVLNTDAEGRLVLADALSVAVAARPDVVVDLATLTAAVRVALGTRYAAIMGTDRSLVSTLIAAAHECGENLWELPLAPEYRKELDSTVADLRNIGDGGAGTIVAGLFLREFVGDVPWAHIDFSSTVMTDAALPCLPRGATGFGVRTLLRYLSGL